MNINKIRSELLDMADSLDSITYDSATFLAKPGETHPFRDKARRLREIALKEMKLLQDNFQNRMVSRLTLKGCLL